ncbi:N5-glutamine S-adenosyl-L-methionine-dependent methyltransferase [Companilactobacillus paralimentarius DSM 13238 = JCM 10415]|uniref:Release factor glutamine methyltransferase n=1 Tax=Companilactobacillus paralimentarius DSM 13238 = JCM 10415 TaxID=1122151 RepID=A0A0R1PGZ8_9LACO|nr:protein-(glutamine-N5) methyltransferase, release factor-specific [Companilactobacillus paralimentarius]KRL31677.1 N5-glutamine S-adenosyl-L-methionine-dependent methyltransferase [Companilactobacillus paralimentarius DSM 13238 = JCM 10415]QFR70154.1 peptide chain release factor N(5)-glutamine methyltransferase [Companilactobacillus paralimentarius]
MLKEQNKFPEDAQYLMEELSGFNYTQLQLHRNEIVPNDIMHKFRDGVVKLGMDVPVQYILGYAYFLNRNFTVNENVLIPRQDTEEMVQKIIDDHSAKNESICDIGTGSGIIAISLGIAFPDDDILATDISAEALKVAQLNADNYQANNVYFQQSDLFKEIKSQQFDVIVSNPPYIAEDEKKDMDPSVIKYEPDLALYGRDNGLEFYENIVKVVDNYLSDQGTLYMEFGFKQKNAINQIFCDNLPNYVVEFHKDMSGNYRYLKAKKEM